MGEMPNLFGDFFFGGSGGADLGMEGEMGEGGLGIEGGEMGEEMGMEGMGGVEYEYQDGE